MQNITLLKEENGKLLIEIDTNLDFGKSASGKSLTIASTKGNTDVAMPGGKVVKLGLNCYIPVS